MSSCIDIRVMWMESGILRDVDVYTDLIVCVKLKPYLLTRCLEVVLLIDRLCLLAVVQL